MDRMRMIRNIAAALFLVTCLLGAQKAVGATCSDELYTDCGVDPTFVCQMCGIDCQTFCVGSCFTNVDYYYCPLTFSGGDICTSCECVCD